MVVLARITFYVFGNPNAVRKSSSNGCRRLVRRRQLAAGGNYSVPKTALNRLLWFIKNVTFCFTLIVIDNNLMLISLPERSPPINEVIQSGVVPRFVEFLARDDYPQLQVWIFILIICEHVCLSFMR